MLCAVLCAVPGEYSGAPTEGQTYDYARTILSLMTEEPHPDGKVGASTGPGVAKRCRALCGHMQFFMHSSYRAFVMHLLDKFDLVFIVNK